MQPRDTAVPGVQIVGGAKEKLLYGKTKYYYDEKERSDCFPKRSEFCYANRRISPIASSELSN